MSSSAAPAGTAEPRADARPAVTVLSGFWPAATLGLARTLLTEDPALLLVRHDLSGIRDGVVHRVVRTATKILEDERVTLVHGCVSCTLREDVLPTLVRLAAHHPGRDIALVLPEVVEPEAVAGACAHCLIEGAPVSDAVRFDSYLTVVDARRLLDDLASTDDLADRGMHAADDDHRGVAEVIVRQIEYADTVVLRGEAGDDAYDTARLTTLLHRLAPWATHVAITGDTGAGLSGRLRDTRRHDPLTPAVPARGIEGYSLGVHEPVPDCGVVSTIFRARRPFHPARLEAALEMLTARALRSRGHLWLASQPDTVIGWESAGGGVAMGSLGRWLDSLPDDRWGEAGDQRRLAAALDWDPYYGDRHSHLVFIGMHLDTVETHRRLSGCLLTDAELATGEAGWRGLPDPFAGCFPVEEVPGRPIGAGRDRPPAQRPDRDAGGQPDHAPAERPDRDAGEESGRRLDERPGDDDGPSA
jgi:G3E family GTPase